MKQPDIPVPPRPTPKEIMNSTGRKVKLNDFVFLKVLGRGSFGKVCVDTPIFNIITVELINQCIVFVGSLGWNESNWLRLCCEGVKKGLNPAWRWCWMRFDREESSCSCLPASLPHLNAFLFSNQGEWAISDWSLAWRVSYLIGRLLGVCVINQTPGFFQLHDFFKLHRRDCSLLWSMLTEEI